MKIAILNKYQNKVARGAETFVLELSARLSKNHKVNVIASVNYLDLLKGRYDIIIPTNGRFQVVLTRLICWLTGAKMVVSGQSGMGWDDKVNLYSFPDAFIALTKKASIWAKEINPHIRVLNIPNGVDLEKFKPKGKVYETGLKKPVVLCGGAFTAQKRMDLSIKAVAKLPQASLLMVGGGGELKGELQRYGEKVLGEDRFKLLSVPFSQMPEVYRAADVFTLPSRSSESFGNVLVEAMASGLPVVATNDPIRREIVGDAGLLVDPTDIKAYAKAIEKALSQNWESIPREQAKKFSWDEIANKYSELFFRLKK
jgi:glycosyltransferase involved in cell wall biosynthesis